MLHSINEKNVIVIKPQSVTAAATVTGTFDCIGYDYVKVLVLLDSEASTTSIPTTLSLQEADTGPTSTSNYSAITQATGGTATSTSVGYVIPNANTSVPNIVAFFVDRRNSRKRYLLLTVAPAATQLLGAVALLGRAEQAPSAAAGRGDAADVFVT